MTVTVFATEFTPDLEACDCGLSLTNVENDTTLYLSDNCATYYFYNLKTNFGKNDFGSCAYVAVAMLLSYYDTYWRDDYIPEVYDINTSCNTTPVVSLESPGIKSEKPLNLYNCEAYIQSINNYTSTYFHSYLVKNGIDLGFLYSETSLGLYFYQRVQLMEHYFYNILGLSDTQIGIEYKTTTRYGFDSSQPIESSANIRAYVISKIKQGIPVIVSNGDHAMIAYDYDQENDDIYVHTGWSTGNKTHVNLDTITPNALQNATIIVDNRSHSCTNNFINDATMSRPIVYCACEFDIHPNHHTHTYSYIKYSNTMHKKECTLCHHITDYGNHIFAPGSTAIIKQCVDCHAYIDTSENLGNLQGIKDEVYADE